MLFPVKTSNTGNFSKISEFSCGDRTESLLTLVSGNQQDHISSYYGTYVTKGRNGTAKGGEE